MHSSPKTISPTLATFAGGCFWCMEPVFRLYKGVKNVVVGYAGGNVKNPTYEQVTGGATGHKEAFQVTYDPGQTAYEFLLRIFLQNINPTDSGGQFYDRGPQYQTAIFYHDSQQKALAEKAVKDLGDSGKFDRPIAVQILPYKNFYPAEDYHQGYYRKNPERYRAYHKGSGRDEYIGKTWGGEQGLPDKP